MPEYNVMVWLYEESGKLKDNASPEICWTHMDHIGKISKRDIDVLEWTIPQPK